MIVVDTSDRDVAAHALGRSFPGLDLARDAEDSPFHFFHSREDRGILRYSRMRVRGSVRTDGVYPDEVAIGRRVAGSVDITYGRDRIDTAQSYLRPPGDSRAVFTDSSTDLISIDTDVFRRLAERHLEGSGQRVRLPSPGQSGPSARAARLWAAVAGTVAADDGSSELRTRILADLVVSTALIAYPMTVATAPPAGQAVGPRTIRRAMEYIDGHLAQPISVVDIAAAALVSVRTLQVGFVRHVGMTPTRYLHEARLRRVRAELMDSAIERTTVAATARRWGFTSPGRFAADYRRRYGENPSDTLRR